MPRAVADVVSRSAERRDARVRRRHAGRALRLVEFTYVVQPRSFTFFLANFFALRTDRNRNKITTDEARRRLRQKTIGVVGLSVGQASAVTLAMEGVGGRFRLADFDTLGLSNMNRPARERQWPSGIKKTVLCARQMFEIDPYLDIALWSEGLSTDTFDRVFLRVLFSGDGALTIS